MVKWVVLIVLAVVVVGGAIISEIAEDEWYKGYMDGIAYYERMMRKEKEDGKKDKEESVRQGY